MAGNKSSSVTDKQKKNLRSNARKGKPHKLKNSTTKDVPNVRAMSKQQLKKHVEQISKVELPFPSILESLKSGGPKIFNTPQEMAAKADAYFRWCIANPWVKTEAKVVNKQVSLVEVPLGRPFTLMGFCLYSGAHSDRFINFKKNLKKDTTPNYDEWVTVITEIEETIRKQKYEGATIGSFNANIISYDLGIRKDVQHSGAGGGYVIIVKNEADNAILNEVIAKLQKIDEDQDEEIKADSQSVGSAGGGL